MKTSKKEDIILEIRNLIKQKLQGQINTHYHNLEVDGEEPQLTGFNYLINENDLKYKTMNTKKKELISTIQLRLRPELKVYAIHKAANKDISVSEFIRNLIEKEKEQKPMKKQLLK